ncbi:HGxxPAAW family protein [Streptomyces sp. NPDC101733]|uniref:HGxxPAAW family protein n=1 Tax=unclassified Streptomyces TaxID=2593676 RepID=UPI003827A026
MSAHHYDEGHTVAGWTGCAVALLGTTIAGVGVCGWTPGIWIGTAVTVAALLITWVLHLAGWGKPSGPRPVSEWAMGVRDRTARAGHPGCVGCRMAGRDPARRTAAAPAPEQALPEPARV